MKRWMGWAISAAALLGAGSAGAQAQPPREIPAGVILVSDFDGPYAAIPPEMPVPYAAALLPPEEVYALLREAGYAPVGRPRLRGLTYSIAAIDLDGAAGRLLVDARSGRIVRFIPADADANAGWYAPRPVPSFREVRPPRPPLPVPRVASRSPIPPLPRPAPPPVVSPPAPPIAAQPLPAPAPAQQTAAVPKPAEAAPAAPSTPPAAVAAKPSPSILPTQEMPPVQGLE
ncbi:hypothetical protein HNR60_004263 [Rhodopseudomonas rhenobacensis]|uniref:PepSY domain-containing protein n=1 Tax=Rhodopseudomonas rhenobacensis TaxID=87461 RepID=A0A7W7Z7X8_9BRAD|nr:hypothetical protein [Rhodopseudomonas rhenobacensis]MBB5049485.1 hypothetical protein [Rhodopseudomonas rhenobacensis]